MQSAATEAGALARGLAEALEQGGFAGDVAFDAASRAAAATDNSVYRLLPDIIVAPRDADDVARLLAVLDRPDFRQVPITARGGGTGTNGQSLNRGVIVDFRRHMTRILDADYGAGWVEVEPGIVLDDLNARVASSGLFFAPTTSTANRCTIGGMVSTDASGKGSRRYGKTSDNVLGLELMLSGGRSLSSLAPAPDWARPLLDEVGAACRAGRPGLVAHVPRLSRRFTGLDLERVCTDAGAPEWWRLLLGAEGTLGLVTRVRLKLVPRPRHRRLAVLAFACFDAVLAAAGRLIEADPDAIEVMDDWCTRKAAEAGLLEPLPAELRWTESAPLSYGFVEVTGEDTRELADRLAKVADIARGLEGFRACRIIEDDRKIAALWAMRAAAVGLLAGEGRGRRPISFVEDCVVPPERLPDFVAGFAGIMERHGLRYGIFGHADVGCLHTRPALDMDKPADRGIYRQVSDEVFRLTTGLGGIFWGEHGKGLRGAYLEAFVGPDAYAAFRRIKRAFDPGNRFNPGKLFAADGALYRIDGTPLRPGAPGDPDSVMANAYGCNGNAACLSVAPGMPMCPSYKVSAELRHSPKGRSEALKAWDQAGGRSAPEALTRDVFEALDGCLGCKSCAGQCPANVDIAELKSRFLEIYYETRRHPLESRAAVWMERLAPVIARLRPLLRPGAALGFDRVLARMIGMVDPPRLSRAAPRVARVSEPVSAPVSGADAILILPDPFSSLFDTPAIDEIAEGFRALGYSPRLLPLVPGGKAAHVTGDRAGFQRMAATMAGMLRQAARSGLPIVSSDPALTWMLRRDYPRAGVDGLPTVLGSEEFLAREIAAGRRLPSAVDPAPGRVFLHCTEQALHPAGREQWKRVFDARGCRMEIVNAGCCGMSGLFGHQARHRDWSRQLFDLSWRDQLGDNEVFATGYSCRCQIERRDGREAAHPMRALAVARNDA